MWSFSLLIVLGIGSVAMCLLTIRRLYAYINKYRFDESVYTLLFRVIRLRYFVTFYMFMVALAVFSGTLFGLSTLLK